MAGRTPVLMALLLAAVIATHASGTHKSIDTESPEVQSVAQWYVDQVNSSGDVQYKLSAVTKATRQLVAGYNYLMTIELKGSDSTTHVREVKVYHDFIHKEMHLSEETEVSVTHDGAEAAKEYDDSFWADVTLESTPSSGVTAYVKTVAVYVTDVVGAMYRALGLTSPREGETAAPPYNAEYKPIVDAIIAVMERATTKESRIALIDKILNQMRLAPVVAMEGFEHIRDDIKIRGYIERIAECGSDNPYLSEFIKDAVASPLKFFSQFSDADAVIPEAVAYMVVLDRLTQLARGDWKKFEAIKKLIDDFSAKNDWRKFANMFERAKKVTIDHVSKQYIDMHRARKVPSNWGRRTLPLNICEACLEDYRLDFDDNAKAGLAIAFEAPGSDEMDWRTGTGPTTFSSDGNGILYRPPLPKEYADMYSTWNMAFVSHYPDAPLFWAKLVNPQVFCYKDTPEEYVYNRAIALYLHIGYTIFGRIDRDSMTPAMDWHQDNLTHQWATHNLKMAGRYEQAIQARPDQDQSWAKAKIKRVMLAFGESSKESMSELMEFIETLSQNDGCDAMSVASILNAARKAGAVAYDLMSAFLST